MSAFDRIDKPVRLQLSRKRGFNLQELSLATNGLPAVNCARPGRWGNPFKVGGVTIFGRLTQTPDVVVDRYKDWLASDKYQDAEERRAELHKLRGKNLACWCHLCDRHKETGKPLDQDCRDCSPCHTDVLGPLANHPICEEVS